MEESSQLNPPAVLNPVAEPPVPIREEAGWVPEPVWTVQLTGTVNNMDLKSNKLRVSPIMSY
jgi:hypothetical protein